MAGRTFASQRGLIDRHRVAVKQARICRNDIALLQLDDIARDQLTRRRRSPLAIALDPGFGGELGFQGGYGVARRAFFPESHHGVRTQQHQDDEKVGPVFNYAREDHGDFNHPGDRTPKVREELQQRIGLLLRQLIRPIFGEPL